MTEEQRKFLESLAKSGVHINQMNVGDHNNIAYNYNAAGSSEKKTKKVDVEILKRCADKVKDMFWSDSAITVIFCTIRDCYEYGDNKSQFERDFHCKPGKISETIINNPFMEKHVDDWEGLHAPKRAIQLKKDFMNLVEEAISEK